MKPGPIAEDRALLRALEEEIPILEEKLRAMKVTRRKLKASVTMTAKRKDKAFNAKMLEASRINNSRPEERERWASVRNLNNPLPFPKGTPERSRYYNLTRKGWTRELAIEKVHAEATA